MKETNDTKTYTFKVWMKDSCYEGKDELEAKIALSDSEVQELRELIDPVEEFWDGLMPILENKAKEIDSQTGERYPLYDKIHDAIFPIVYPEYLAVFLNGGSIKKDSQDSSDTPYPFNPDLCELLAPYIPCETSEYVCEIPKELIPKVYLTKEAGPKEILHYLKREHLKLMDELLIDFIDLKSQSNDDTHEPVYWDSIEERLSAIVSSKIQGTTPEELQSDDYNPLKDFDKTSFWNDYRKWKLDHQKK